MKQFKILKAFGETRKDIPDYFPWSLLNEKNAGSYHSQSLERLNERGGLTVEEIYCNITSTQYHKQRFDHDKVIEWVKIKIEEASSLGKDNGILPCPFCGSKEGENVILGYEYPNYRIACVPCSIIMRHDRKDKVIEHWNNRAQ